MERFDEPDGSRKKIEVNFNDMTQGELVAWVQRQRLISGLPYNEIERSKATDERKDDGDDHSEDPPAA